MVHLNKQKPNLLFFWFLLPFLFYTGYAVGKLEGEEISINKNMIVCSASGAAIDFEPIEMSSRAILHMGLAGEAAGSAAVDILFGRANPSGKLTETFPVCIENTPCYPDFPGYCDEITYSEGLLQGYRYYDTKRIPVRYPFGHGLSYTCFSYSNLRVSSDCLRNGETLDVMLDVTNTGSAAGSEIVQIYVSDPESYMPRPTKELKGFSRVWLEPGETKTAAVQLPG